MAFAKTTEQTEDVGIDYPYYHAAVDISENNGVVYDNAAIISILLLILYVINIKKKKIEVLGPYLFKLDESKGTKRSNRAYSTGDLRSLERTRRGLYKIHRRDLGRDSSL